ncbi:MAG: hypothetical protein N2444_00120 [Methylocystis sp.]|nr:hypothetical protein [Methylocystis sp.]
MSRHRSDEAVALAAMAAAFVVSVVIAGALAATALSFAGFPR